MMNNLKIIIFIFCVLTTNNLYTQELPSEITYQEIQNMSNVDYNNYKYVDVIEQRFQNHQYSPNLGSNNWTDILIWDTSQFSWRENYQYFFDKMNSSYFYDFFSRLINGDRYNKEELNRFYSELRMEYENVPLKPDIKVYMILVILLIIYYKLSIIKTIKNKKL